MMTSGTVLRGTIVGSATAAALALAIGRTADLRHPATHGFDDLLVAGAGWALALGIAWVGLLMTAAVVEVASGGRVALTSRLGCPAVARRTVLAALTLALAGGGAALAAPASAAPDRRDPTLLRAGTASATLPVPARPVGAIDRVPRQRVEVRPGDSLWLLARQRSPRRASTQDVARLVARAYRSNRGVIGPDPDLIRPGQRLHLPDQRRDTPPPLEAP